MTRKRILLCSRASGPALLQRLLGTSGVGFLNARRHPLVFPRKPAHSGRRSECHVCDLLVPPPNLHPSSTHLTFSRFCHLLKSQDGAMIPRTAEGRSRSHGLGPSAALLLLAVVTKQVCRIPAAPVGFGGPANIARSGSLGGGSCSTGNVFASLLLTSRG